MKGDRIMKLKYLGMYMLTMACLSSCYDDCLYSVQVPTQQVEVSFRFSGEITSDYSPLTRAMTTDDLLGIQVYKGRANYAYGLFDNIADMKLKLDAEGLYKFIVTVVKDGKNKIRYGHRYGYPFGSSSDDYHYRLTNSFNYGGDYRYYNQYTNLGIGKTKMTSDSDNYLSYQDYPETDRFYGEVDNYTIKYGSDPTVINMDLKRAAFGLKYEVTGLSDGTASITIKNDSRTFFENTSISDAYSSEAKVFTFSNVRDAWLYADDGYVENVTVSMTWTRSIGITQDLGSKTVQIKRNALNNIRVSLSEDYGGSALKIDVEDAAMGNENVTIPVKQ